MIRTIHYTLLAEGIVENAFIPELLQKIHGGKLRFSKSHLSLKQSASPSKSKVFANIAKFAKESLIIQEEDLFIVGVDLDVQDYDLNILKKEEKKIYESLGQGIDNSKVIIFIPIQAFDHWLLYQSYRLERKERIVDNSLESKDTYDVKKDLYDTSHPNANTIRKKAKAILGILDIKDLTKQSKSFKHFYDQLIAVN
jgi:hypothetical protein